MKGYPTADKIKDLAIRVQGGDWIATIHAISTFYSMLEPETEEDLTLYRAMQNVVGGNRDAGVVSSEKA